MWTRTACLIILGLSAPAAAAQTGRDGGEPLPGEECVLRRLHFRETPVVDALRLLSEVSGLNVVATTEAGKRPVTFHLQETDAGRAVETLCKVAGLWFRRDADTGTLRVMTTEEFQKDHVIYRKDEIRVFTLDYPNAVSVAVAVQDLFGDRVELSLGMDDAQLDLLGGLEGTGAYGGLAGGYTGGGGGRTLFGGFRGGLPSFRSQPGGGYGFRRGTALPGAGYERPGRSGPDYGTRGARGREETDRQVLDEPLTPGQLAELRRRLEGRREAGAEELRGISKRAATVWVTVNRQHNLIVVRTSDAETMERIARLVDDLDRPTPQVLLEMKILQLRVEDSFRSVFDFDVAGGTEREGPPSDQVANPLLPGAATAPKHVLGVGNFPLEGGTFVYQFLNDTVRARIQLLARDGRAEVVATPLVLASNNRMARIFIGEERVLTTGVETDVVTPSTGAATAFVEPVTEIRDVGTTLAVIPKINADRTVTLLIAQDSSRVSPDSADIPIVDPEGGVSGFPIDTITTANFQATVVAKDRMTLAIGGLIQEEVAHTEEKVPFLGDIPILGIPFRKSVRRHVKSELILLITPRVLFTPAEARRASRRVEESSQHPAKGGRPPAGEGR